MSDYYAADLARLTEIADGFLSGTEAFEVIVKYSGDIRLMESGLSVEAEDLGGGFAIITLQSSQLPELYDYAEIEYVELPKTLTLSLDKSLDYSCVTAVQSTAAYGLTGEGTLIGVIDSGIDYTHPDFRGDDGSSRILYIWDQTESGNPPRGFKQGAEYGNEQINAALLSAAPFEVVPSADMLGHGTAVAGIAAGNGRAGGGRYKGAAPSASLIVVKLGYRGFESFARTTEVMRAVKYVIDKAETLGMPLSVNLSYGANDGSHDGSSLFEAYINSAAQRWKTVIAVATGNEGASGRHFSGRAESARVTGADFIIAERIYSLYLTFWKNFADTFALELIFPDGGSSGELRPSPRFSTIHTGNIVLQVYYGTPSPYNENQEIFFSIKGSGAAIPQGIWRLRIRGVEVVDGRFDIWLPTVEETGRGVAFTAPSADTTLTLPSTVEKVISVAGYNAAVNAAAQFSGRGFTRGSAYVKPDIAAPAVGIMSTRPGGSYDSFTGTSMAAPFVAGAAALMMQWGIVLKNDSFLYGQRLKAFLKKGAKRNEATAYPNPIWGYGAICLKDTMDYLAQSEK